MVYDERVELPVNLPGPTALSHLKVVVFRAGSCAL